MTLYVTRPGPFTPPTTWRVEAGALSENRIGRPERRWPLSGVRVVRLAPAANRYVPDTAVLRVVFRTRAVSIGSHSFEGLGHYRDQTQAFGGFVRALCAEVAAAAPAARFEAGRDRAAGVFTGAMAILAAGIVFMLLASVAGGLYALGLNLTARLAFVLLLMVAAQPWLAGAGPRRFDPGHVTAETLAGGRT